MFMAVCRKSLDRIDIVIVHLCPLVRMDEGGERRRLFLVPIAVVIERHLPIPWVALEGEFEIASPDFLVDVLADLRRLSVIIVAIILGLQFDPLQRMRRFPPAMQPPVLRPSSIGTQRLIHLAEGRDNVFGSAKLAQGKLDACPSGLLGFKENELVLVREDY